MKSYRLHTLYILSFLWGSMVLTSCQKEDILDVDYSKYANNNSLVGAQTETDNWIEENLREPYNIKVLWRYQDIETHLGYNVIPPMEEHVQPFLEIFKDVFLKSYIEVYQGSDQYQHPEDFIRTYVPKQIMLLGEWEYQGNGEIVLGVAEAGKKIYLTGINYWEDPSELERFMRTIFHEFSHILHQTKLYDIEFEQITKEGYTAQWSNPIDNQDLRFRQAREQGFVSDYARKNRDEDFVETLAYYLILSDEGWSRMLNDIDGSIAGDEAFERAKAETPLNTEGMSDEEAQIEINRVNAILNQARVATANETARKARADIEEKRAFVEDYLNKQWGIKLAKLKQIVQNNYNVALKNNNPTADVSALRSAIDTRIIRSGLLDKRSEDEIAQYTCVHGDLLGSNKGTSSHGHEH